MCEQRNEWRRSYYLLESCNFKTEVNSPFFLEQWSLPTTAALAAESLTCHFITNGHIWKSKCHRYTGQYRVSEDASGGYSCGFLRTSADFGQWSFLVVNRMIGAAVRSRLDCSCHWYCIVNSEYKTACKIQCNSHCVWLMCKCHILCAPFSRWFGNVRLVKGNFQQMWEVLL